jgi:hypothetical protein
MNIKFVHAGGPYGDATSNYDVLIPEGATVREFLLYIVKTYSSEQGEWGSIHLADDDYTHLVDYNRGKFTGAGDNFYEYLDCKITKVSANGGWSNMSYRIHIERNEDET